MRIDRITAASQRMFGPSKFGISTRRRLFFFLSFLALAVLAPPGLIGMARAQSSDSGDDRSSVDAIGWMQIHDSTGAPLANYQFATKDPGILHPGNTVLWSALGFELTLYIVVMSTAIWIIGMALSFKWLDMLANPLRGLAGTVTDQLATPMMLVTAATIGALVVAWFVVRGFHSKAASQSATMVLVGIAGPFFLADPLADVLSADGLMARGRDLGIAVVAGLQGRSAPAAGEFVTNLQTGLADNLVRKPVQVWNFGHVLDNDSACRNAWTTGISAGSSKLLRSGLEKCGDSTVLHRIDHPTMAQVGTGLVLILCGLITIVFGVYMAIKIMRTAFDAIYYAFMTIFGFAAGGFIYGPTQTHLVRSLVHSFVSGFKMIAFIIFLGIYLVLLGDLFDQAKGQIFAVLIIVVSVEIIAVTQLRRLDFNLDRGNDWIANRFALATQGGFAASATGRTALGMPSGGSGGHSSTRLLTTVAAVNTVNSSPIAAWAAGRTMGPLNPFAARRKRAELANMDSAPLNREGQQWLQLNRLNWRQKALARAGEDGLGTTIGVANALDGLTDSRVPDLYLAPVLLATGATDQGVIDALRALAVQKASLRDASPYGFAPLQKALAAAMAVDNHVGDRAHEAFAAQAVVAAANFRRHANAPDENAVIDHNFVGLVERSWDSESAIRRITPDQWNNAGRDTRYYIGNRLAENHLAIAERYHRSVVTNDPALEQHRQQLRESARRINNLHHLKPEMGADPWQP
ncbi:hypothetical protein [Nocardia veterana]|uniref:TrbL/VirB6 plasmid conjugal transfer protein n=1 Tax=Nocardia veterana TaxID=132249 RepID=A0A7X6LW83_9NOCA|nr:hypothetical protein [Nocardia veterana]NKY85653.1 hypothetical protein [Nocardia veterana]